MSLDIPEVNNKAWMTTQGGEDVFPLELKVDQINIRDIAHSLAQQTRYNGHCKFIYPIGQHSLLISRALKRDGYDRMTQLVGLMHDASETYTGDLTKPMKNSLKDALRPYGQGEWFKNVERNIEFKIAQRFGLPFPWPYVIEEYDTRIVVDEKEVLFPKRKPWFAPMERLNVEIKERDWRTIKRLFLQRFYELQP